MTYRANELFGKFTNGKTFPDVSQDLITQPCPYRKENVCFKNRKSSPEIKIGTCSAYVLQRDTAPSIICPYRMTENNRIFNDCLSMIDTTGTDLYLIPELYTEAGNIDYVLASIQDDSVIDFVGIEIQTLDTTGSIWPYRQEMLIENGYSVEMPVRTSKMSFGSNKKMSGKTILAQMVQKVELFSNIGKSIVLVIQDSFLDCMKNDFDFSRIHQARQRDTVHFHSYSFVENNDSMHIKFENAESMSATDFENIMGMNSLDDDSIQIINSRILSRVCDEYRYSPVINQATLL